MFDPNRIVISTKALMVIRTETTDRIMTPAPLREVIDPRRYSVTLWPGTSRRRTLYSGRLYRATQR